MVGLGLDVPDHERFLGGFVSEAHFEHLVEVAVKDFTGPGGVDGVAAHQAVDSGGVEGFAEELIVFF